MAKASVVELSAGPAASPGRPAQVVRRPGGRVVVILFGRDALSEASAWRRRGYEVEPVSGEAVGF